MFRIRIVNINSRPNFNTYSENNGEFPHAANHKKFAYYNNYYINKL